MSHNLYIVPYDFSKTSEKALEYALFLAEKVKTEIQILHLSEDKPKGMAMRTKLEELKAGLTIPQGAEVSVLVRVGNIFTDIGKIVQLAQRHRIKTVADNTFASPIHTRPIEWGIDLSMSSATKYLGGHSDVTAGVIAGSDADVTACWKVARLTGPTIDPIGAWLLHRGIKTLALRVTRSSASAMTLAQWLSQHPQVERVDYPGLPSHPGHEIAKRQMQDGFGGVLSFQIQGGLEAGSRFCESLQMVYRAVSLGGVESLIQHPASMTHIFVDEATKKNLGITPGLLRFATGIEDVQDIQSDFEQAFTAAL